MLNLSPPLREALGLVLAALVGARPANRTIPRATSGGAVVRWVRRPRRVSVVVVREGGEV